MAKGKSGKRSKEKKEPRTAGSLTVKVHSKKDRPSRHFGEKEAQAAPNPYEVFQNKHRKSKVLGERRSGDKRNLVKSRADAVAERARGLLKDSMEDRRVSTFRDARLGANDPTLGSASVQRMVKLRQKETKKSFTLNAKGQDELMHGGKRLEEMEDGELAEGEEEQEDNTVWDPDDPVAQGKMRKAEEARERKEHEEQMSKLDDDFGDIMGDLNFRPKKAELLRNEPAKKEGPDEYDRLMREMVYEKKAHATERLKTPEEIAREKAEELEALERERSARARASVEGEEGDEAGENAPEGVLDPSGDEGSGDEVEGEESEEEDVAHEEADDAEAEAEPSKDDASTLKVVAGSDVDDDDRLGEDCIPLLSAKKAGAVDVMVNAKGEEGLPYAFECPKKRRAIEALLAGKGPETAVKLVHRVRTCNAVSIAAGNRDKLRAFFLALLDYAANVAVRDDGDLSARGLQILYALRPQLVQLAREHPDEAHGYFVERLRVLSPTTLPRVPEVCCLKLVAILFPVTDFQHPITRPVALLGDHWATRIASLGAEIADLISDAIFLWGALYDLTISSGRFSMSFFQLGATILDSCWTSAEKGREQITDASTDILALLLKALRALAESESAAAHVVVKELLRPAAQKLLAKGVPDGTASKQLKSFMSALDEVCQGGLAPLTLFEAAPPQIKSLEPVFHEEGDTSMRRRGMELSETQMLKRQLNDERRAANRQLRRDSSTLQTMAANKDSLRRTARGTEKKRVEKMMDAEKSMLKQMMTEGGGMDTSIQSYSKNKEKKKLNKRMAGNMTAKDGPGGTGQAEKGGKVGMTPKKRKGR